MKKFFTIILFAAISLSAAAQKITVTGVVKDENGQPLPAAVVADKTTKGVGVTTDINGHYSIAVDAKGVIEFSFMGYTSVIESVNGRSKIDVSLKPASTTLNETVVIGYGTSKKSDLTGAVSVVEMDDIASTPATNVAQSLQGRVTGVDIVSGTGEAGEDLSIQIRGARSISAGNEPLIVVDGVLDAVASLSDINPADIVNISVLKDVSSTAIYGSRGANGVILVTTEQKEKADNKVYFTLRSSTGVNLLAGKLDLMDATDYAYWRNMYKLQGNMGTSNTVENLPMTSTSSWPFYSPEAMGKGTDWVEALSRTGVYTDNYLNMYSAGKSVNIWASIGHTLNRGVVIGSSWQRVSGRMNVDTKIGKRIKAGVRFNFNYVDAERTNAAISGTNTSAAIFLSPILNTESTWNQYGFQETEGFIFNNPYISATQITNNADKWHLALTPWINLDITKNLKLNSTFTFIRDNHLSYYYSPSYLPEAAVREKGGTASRSYWDERKFLSETTLNYKKTFARHHSVELLGGFTASKRVQDNATYKGSGYINDDTQHFDMSQLINASNFSATSFRYIKTTMSALARANYSYRRRYYLTFTARADGASNFAANRKWGFFPAAAFRWSIMNEDFCKKAYWLNDLSLRVSAGRSGNDAISSYLSLATISTARSSWVFGDQTYLSTLPQHLANSNLTWETTDSYNLGLNFTAFSNRLSIEADAYMSQTHDLLLSVRNSQVTGYDSYFTNMGETRNIGVEVNITTKNIVKKNFLWTTSLTLSHNTQTVVDSGAGNEVVPTYMNPANSTEYIYGYKTGYPVNALWGYQYGGVWHNQAEIDRNNYTHTYVATIKDGANGSNIGRAKYMDINGDGSLNQDDIVYLGNSDPVIYGGFQNNFTICKDLTLGVYFTYSLGGKIYNLSEIYLGSSSSNYNKYRYVLDAWDATRNPDSDIPRAGYSDSLASDRQVHDASFLRLKTLSLAYNIPLNKKVKKHIRGINLGFSAENVFLVKSYNGFDPDVSTSSSVRRLDNGSLPRSRTFTFNFELKF